MLNILVLYYSRSGKTRQAANKLADVLGAETEEIIDQTNRKGAWGFLKSGREAVTGVEPEIMGLGKDLARFDMVVVCTPVWAGKPSSPVRAALKKYGRNIKKAAFLITRAAAKEDFAGAFAVMDEDLGKKRMAAKSLCSTSKTYLDEVEKFAQELKQIP